MSDKRERASPTGYMLYGDLKQVELVGPDTIALTIYKWSDPEKSVEELRRLPRTTLAIYFRRMEMKSAMVSIHVPTLKPCTDHFLRIVKQTNTLVVLQCEACGETVRGSRKKVESMIGMRGQFGKDLKDSELNGMTDVKRLKREMF